MEDPELYKAIVIGTSAGGLMAITAILEKLPHDYSLPIIIIQHRSKEPRKLFEEILQYKSRIRIKQADEKEKIKGAFAYVAPPDYHLLIEQDHTFSLASDEPVRFSRPSIDVTFESAADVYRDRLIGIVLTGSNEDGARGVKAIAAFKGLVMAQKPEEAEYSVMPRAAISTRVVNHVFTLNEIASFLMRVNQKKP